MKKGKTLYEVFEEYEKRKAPASTGAREDTMSDSAYGWIRIFDEAIHLTKMEARAGVKHTYSESPRVMRLAGLELMRLLKEATK